MADDFTDEDSEPETIDVGDLQLDDPESAVRKTRLVEGTRARLAYCLVAILGGVLLILLLMVWTHVTDADGFEKMASVLLAPLVGLVGAATGYYYGRTQR